MVVGSSFQLTIEVCVSVVDSPLNSYLYVHWILDFKQLLLLLLLSVNFLSGSSPYSRCSSKIHKL